MITVGFKVSPEMLAKIDAAAAEHCLTRAAYLAQIISQQDQIAELAKTILQMSKYLRLTSNMVAEMYQIQLPDGTKRFEDLKKEMGF